nr:hypothetical protein CFP56_19012 [Quercus suber]
MWVSGDWRGGGCGFVEISVYGGHQRLCSRWRCGSQWLLGCGIDGWVMEIGDWVVGIDGWVVGFGDWVVESVIGLSVLVSGLWETSLAATSLDTKARVTILENILGIPTSGEQLFVCDRLDALSAETTVIWNEIFYQRDVVLICVEELAATLDA